MSWVTKSLREQAVKEQRRVSELERRGRLRAANPLPMTSNNLGAEMWDAGCMKIDDRSKCGTVGCTRETKYVFRKTGVARCPVCAGVLKE